MLGPHTAPRFNAKAKETHGLVPFCAELLDRYSVRLQAEPQVVQQRATFLRQACRHAMEFDALLASTHRADVPFQEALLSHVLRFNKLMHVASGNLLPKSHALVHMAQNADFHGNPKGHSTFHDESVNGLVKKIAASSHRSTFAHTVLTKLHILRCNSAPS
jgi:hypothetical protein